MDIGNITKRISIIFAALLLTACVINQTPSSDWHIPKPIVGNACPDITGTYMAVFECVGGVKTPNPSSPLLGKRPGEDVTHISIHRKDQDSLSASALANGKIIFSNELSLASGDFSCEDGWIKIHSVRANVVGATLVAGLDGESQTDSYTRSGEYLIVNMSTLALGFMIVPVPFPLAVSYSTWCRSPIHNENEDSLGTNQGWRPLQAPEVGSQQSQGETMLERP